MFLKARIRVYIRTKDDADGSAVINLHREDWHGHVQCDVSAFNHLQSARQDAGIDVQYEVVTSLCEHDQVNKSSSDPPQVTRVKVTIVRDLPMMTLVHLLLISNTELLLCLMYNKSLMVYPSSLMF